MYVRLFADHYPSEVVGMVLVDPVSEEQGRRYFELDPSTRTQNDAYVESIHSECIPAASKGFDTASDVYKKCVGEPDKRFSAAFNRTFMANHSRPESFQAAWSEWVNVFTVSSDQVRAEKKSYGDMPLVILTRAPWSIAPKATQTTHDAKVHLWMELHDDLAQLSTRGVNQVVPDASHYIQFDQPAAVTKAILTVLKQTSTSNSPGTDGAIDKSTNRVSGSAIRRPVSTATA